MGTVMNMQAFSSLGVLVLVLTIVRAEYWWMDTQAFGGQGDSGSQVRGTSSGGGYGGGGSSGKTHDIGQKPQNGGGNTGSNLDGILNAFGDQADKESQVKRHSSGGGYGGNRKNPQNTGRNPQNVLNLNDKFPDFPDAPCPAESTCVSQSECQQTPVRGLQERGANYVQCSPSKICCTTSNVSPLNDPLPGSGSSFSSSSILQPPPGIASLPQTQCSQGWKCVSELFCDVTATMVPFRVELTAEERNRRGDLTPCMNQATSQFDVCCKKPSSLPRLENNQIVTSQRQQIRDPTCPAINILPPIEQCRGRPSNCWSVGVADTDCIGNALCCFDGCANVCQGKGPVNGNPGPQTNGRGQQRQEIINSANPNINNNKQEVFQLLTQPPIKEQLGASSPSIHNVKPNNDGQLLSSQNQPFIQSIQKKPATQNPINPLQNQPLINTIKNKPTVDGIYTSQYGPEAGDGYGNSQFDITSRPKNQDQSISPVYKNQDGFIFPEDNEEPRFPTFPKKRNPSYSNISPVTQQTEDRTNPIDVTQTNPIQVTQTNPIQVIQTNPIQVTQTNPIQVTQTNPIQVTQPNSIQDILQPTAQVTQTILSKEIQPNLVEVIQQNPVKVFQPVQEIQQNPSPPQQSGELASSQPFVTCPSAMKCVPKINCNFNGVMVEEEVVLSEVMETQRVPLIPCFSPVRRNAVDVCCRDPNYKDPWPQNGNYNNGQFNNGNNGQFNNGNDGQFNNRNNGQFNNGNNGQFDNGNNGQFSNGDNGQFNHGTNGQLNHGNNGQFNPTQQGKVQASTIFQEQIKTDIKVNIPKKRKTHGYGK